MITGALNKERVWFYERDSQEDGVCYERVDPRKMKHEDLVIGSSHPESHTDPEMFDMVLVYKEPYKGSVDEAHFWYAPRSLVDDLVSVNTVGTTRTSSLLYARGQEPPAGDPRVPLLGDKKPSPIFTLATEGDGWSGYTDTDNDLEPENVIALSVLNMPVETLDQNEVYMVVVTSDNEDVIPLGTHLITRHARSGETWDIQIAGTYDPNNDPLSAITITAEFYYACWLLDGYEDSESAPGALSGKFHTRRFAYRLGLENNEPTYDDLLGLEVERRSRIVPSSWAFQTNSDESSIINIGSATAAQRVQFSMASKTLAELTTLGPSGLPALDGFVWNTKTKIQVPASIFNMEFMSIWARAIRGPNLGYDEDFQVRVETKGPYSLPMDTKITRKIYKQADMGSAITAYVDANHAGVLFNFEPESYSIPMGVYIAYAASDGNMFARAQLRVQNIGPFMIAPSGGTIVPMTAAPYERYTISADIPAAYAEAFPNGADSAAEDVAVRGKTISIEGNAVPWGTTNVLFDIRVQQARWDYWVVDFVSLDFPAEPADPVLTITDTPG